MRENTNQLKSKYKTSHFAITCNSCKGEIYFPMYKFFRTGRVDCPFCNQTLIRRVEKRKLLHDI